MSRSEQPDEYDSPWKEALEVYFEPFMALLFPEIHGDIDWSCPPVLLDKELQKVVREAEVRKGAVDKLIKVRRLSGEEAWVLVHIEIQSQRDAGFEQRMFVYHYRIFDRYGRIVVSLAVLADDEASWRPAHFSQGLWGCRAGLWFPAVKLLDLAAKWDRLEESKSPFAVVVMAHLKAQATRHDPEERLRWKLRLARRLYQRGYSRHDILSLYRFIDWVMVLPQKLERKLDAALVQDEKEQSMPYITSIERHGLEKGKRQGLKEGKRQAIAQALEVRFGAVPATVVKALSKMSNLAVLNELLRQAILAESLEAFERAMQERVAR